MNEKIKVIYSDTGLANFFGDHIEINKNLRKDKVLRDYIMKHELGHSKKFDLWHEFDIDWKIMPRLFSFLIRNPSTWIDFLPVQIKKRRLIFDLNLTILYIFGIVAVFFSIYFLIKFLK